jgi:flagellar hook-associated protein 1
MSILSLFDISRTSLLTSKRAIDATAHNVSNSATTGYTRQDVILSSIPSGPILSDATSGRGVRITEVKRMYDSFTTFQLRHEKANLSYWDTFNTSVIKIENLFNETSESSLSTAMTDFFNAWKEISQNPEGYPQRALLLNKAEYLSTRISRTYSTLQDERIEILKDSEALINEVNNIGRDIADLNVKIAGSPSSHDLRDQRDILVERLNEIIRVSTFEDNAGRYSVLIGGTPIVDGGTAYDMSVAADADNNLVFFVNLPNEQRDITNLITAGELKAHINLRDDVIVDYMNRINALALSITDGVNGLHRGGVGLDGSTGNAFFNDLFLSSDPPGGGSITSVQVSDTALMSYDRFRIVYTPDGDGDGVESAGDYAVTDLTTGQAVTVQNFTADPGGNGRTMEFMGLRVTIGGAITAPETFEVQLKEHAALGMSLSLQDARKIAAGLDPSLLPGDNRNALAMADLADQSIVAGRTVLGFYREIVTDVGVEAQSAKRGVQFQQTLVEELEKRRQEISGVNLDEEAANLIKYQKSFEAAAKMIAIADELLTTLIGMVGRQ